MDKSKFQELWEVHNKWIKGVVIDEIISLDSANLYLSKIPGIYTNYAIPTITSISELNLEDVHQIFKKREEKDAFYLLEELQEVGFDNYLISNGFKIDSHEAWMVLDQRKFIDREIKIEVTRVDENNFNDFDQVLIQAFSTFPGMEEYLAMCKRLMSSGPENYFSDFCTELYLIYDSGKPAAAAGLFFSRQGNFGYLHTAGTKKEFRG